MISISGRGRISLLVVVGTLGLGSLPASPASITIPLPTRIFRHPIKTVKSTTLEGLLKSSIVGLEISNAVDLTVTEIGVAGGPFCETGVFANGQCGIYNKRFVLAKSGVAMAGILEWVPIWLGYHSPTYESLALGINTALTSVLVTADKHNISTLAGGIQPKQ